MKRRPITTTATANTRPNRVLIALAAAWMILSLAIGGLVYAGSPSEEGSPTSITRQAVQP